MIFIKIINHVYNVLILYNHKNVILDLILIFYHILINLFLHYNQYVNDIFINYLFILFIQYLLIHEDV